MKERIRQIVLSLGADACGFANIESFSKAPSGFHPKDTFEGCRSVIVFIKALPKGLSKTSPRIVYQRYNSFTCDELDRISLQSSIEIEKSFGCLAVPVPSDGPYEYWDEQKKEGRGLLSMKHAAMLAGLGALGKNTLLVSLYYGNMVNIGALMTDLDLASDEPAAQMCKEGCSLCLDSCPSAALDGHSANQQRCRENAYETNARGFAVTNCNICRLVCPLAFGER